MIETARLGTQARRSPRFAPLLFVLALACTRRSPPATELPATQLEGAPARHAELPDPPGTYLGRTLATPMSYLGADWLERPEREARERPEHVLDVLGIREGSVVADVGAGTGYFSIRLARRVGPRGEVIATDVQPEMLDRLRARVAKADVHNVVPILATATDAGLPPGVVDLTLMVDVYHELPNPRGTLGQIRRALKPDGRIALVEYRGEDPAVAIKPEHKMTLAQIRTELEASGFVFVESDESLPDQRIVVFRR